MSRVAASLLRLITVAAALLACLFVASADGSLAPTQVGGSPFGSYGYDAPGSSTTLYAASPSGPTRGYHDRSHSPRAHLRASGPHATKAVPEGATSKILLRDPRQLQSKFKHASDFGVTGNYSRANAVRFSEAIHRHINDSGVRAIQGAYRKQPVTHHIDPASGLNVMSDPAGNLISGWRLSQAQRRNVLKHGGL